MIINTYFNEGKCAQGASELWSLLNEAVIYVKNINFYVGNEIHKLVIFSNTLYPKAVSPLLRIYMYVFVSVIKVFLKYLKKSKTYHSEP